MQEKVSNPDRIILTNFSNPANILPMMSETTAAAIETIKRQLRSLRAVAGNVAEGVADWQDAEAIDAIADEIKAQLEAIELDAEEENTDGELLAA